MVENPGFYGNLSARENLDLHRHLMGVADKKAAEQALKKVGLADVDGRPVQTFSTGMKQRLGLARAMLHEPEIFILDEPTNGLDPAGIREVRELLKERSGEKATTIFLSSHILGEVRRVANRIGFIHQGILLDELDAHQLARRTRNHLELEVDDVKRTVWLLEEHLGIDDYRVEPGEWSGFLPS